MQVTSAAIDTRVGRFAFSGQRTSALVVATVITLAAAIPLAVIAWDARDTGPASAEGLNAIVDGAPMDLSGLTVGAGAIERLEVADDDLVAVAWVLYVADGDLVSEGEAIGGSPFLLDAAVGDLDDGIYDLLVSGTDGDGATVQRAARFQVGD